MLDRMTAGTVPDKPHTALRDGAGRLRHEECLTREGFESAYTILYHLRPPTRVRAVEFVRHWEPERAGEMPLRHHHLKTAALPRAGDPYTGRVPFLCNKEMIAWRCRPARGST